jgi:hypothetical protein
MQLVFTSIWGPVLEKGYVTPRNKFDVSFGSTKIKINQYECLHDSEYNNSLTVQHLNNNLFATVILLWLCLLTLTRIIDPES